MADIVYLFLILLMLGFQYTVEVVKQNVKILFIEHQDILWKAYVINEDALPNGQYYFQNGTRVEAREPTHVFE